MAFNEGRTALGDFGMFGPQDFSRVDQNTLNTIAPVDSVFQQAGDLQSGAITEAGGIESASFDQAIQALNGLIRSPQDLDQMLAEIMGTDSFGALRSERERSVTGLASAGGFTRGGAGFNEIANVPTELAFDIESTLNNRNQSQISQLISLLLGQGSVEGGAIRGSAEAEASGILGEKSFDFQRDQQRDSSRNDMIGSMIMAAGIAFSDPRLKENITQLGDFHGLQLVQWDWKPEFKDTIVSKYPTVGFLSTEVKEKCPQYVGEFGGFDTIDYKGLLEEICH